MGKFLSEIYPVAIQLDNASRVSRAKKKLLKRLEYSGNRVPEGRL